MQSEKIYFVPYYSVCGHASDVISRIYFALQLHTVDRNAEDSSHENFTLPF